MSSARLHLSLTVVALGAGVSLGLLMAEWHADRQPQMADARDLCVQVAYTTRQPTLYVPDRGCRVSVQREPKKETELWVRSSW